MGDSEPKKFPEIWQPIASAPRDGTFVLTRSGYWAPCITHFGTYDGRTRWGASPEGFMEEDHFLQYWHEVTYEPTHWMPLPDTEVADVIEAAYRNGFEDGERQAGDAAKLAQSYANTYKSQLDALISRLKAGRPVAWLRPGEYLPIPNCPFGATWISDKDDPRAFPVYAAPLAEDAPLFGPYAYLNGPRALPEDSWSVEDDPIENNEEYFSIPLFARFEVTFPVTHAAPDAAAYQAYAEELRASTVETKGPDHA